MFPVSPWALAVALAATNFDLPIGSEPPADTVPVAAPGLAAPLVAPPPNAFGPPIPEGPQEANTADCWSAPIDLSITQILGQTGTIGQHVARRYCLRRSDADPLRFRSVPYVVGRSRLGRLRLFGEQLSYGFDVVLMPGRNGSPDYLYTAPAVDLPERWELAIEKATYPVLIVGSAALLTTIILQLAR